MPGIPYFPQEPYRYNVDITTLMVPATDREWFDCYPNAAKYACMYKWGYLPQYAQALANTLAGIMKNYSPIKTGRLRRSISGQVLGAGRTISIVMVHYGVAFRQEWDQAFEEFVENLGRFYGLAKSIREGIERKARVEFTKEQKAIFAKTGGVPNCNVAPGQVGIERGSGNIDPNHPWIQYIRGLIASVNGDPGLWADRYRWEVAQTWLTINAMKQAGVSDWWTASAGSRAWTTHVGQTAQSYGADIQLVDFAD